MNAGTRSKALPLLRHGSAIALADLAVIYTWKTWLFGWLVRMLSQVLFFTLVARLTDAGGDEEFLVIGNALMVCAIEATMVVASSAWERSLGTLPLLVAAPTHLAWTFVVRSLQWVLTGTATSLVALFVLGPVFGVRWTPGSASAAVVLVLLTALGTYCVGLALAALVADRPSLRNLVSNVAYLGMMVVCGVQVPVDYWPVPVQLLAQTIPLTHELAALRGVVDGDPAVRVLGRAVLGVVTGAGWLAMAVLGFGRVARRGRRTGTIEFGT
ncbi:ABC transporter permease [Streptomyces cinnabarinus]|uniref:ABC transporter permease n=1 Tax=Streptomyces cinnabarinus TaxID=67287 RepID=A0ABY7KN20_9ACTN|nr:ABC transporter permease [Streptomyces cinnabarinus]WAZ25060.1 ABC transporter permease [Streptomyces cinnabarinus]